MPVPKYHLRVLGRAQAASTKQTSGGQEPPSGRICLSRSRIIANLPPARSSHYGRLYLPLIVSVPPHLIARIEYSTLDHLVYELIICIGFLSLSLPFEFVPVGLPLMCSRLFLFRGSPLAYTSETLNLSPSLLMYPFHTLALRRRSSFLPLVSHGARGCT